MGTRGRKKLEIDKSDLERVISELEAKQTFNTLGDLFKAVENCEWAKSVGLKAAVAYQRFRLFNITCKTKPGERGQHLKGNRNLEGAVRITRAEKNVAFANSFKAMKAEFGEKYYPLIDRAKRGSTKAAIKLMCLSCTNFQPLEVKNCECISCPLYALR